MPERAALCTECGRCCCCCLLIILDVVDFRRPRPFRGRLHSVTFSIFLDMTSCEDYPLCSSSQLPYSLAKVGIEIPGIWHLSTVPDILVLDRISLFQHWHFLYFFCRATPSPIYDFEGCLHSNSECCCSKRVRYNIATYPPT